MRTGTEHDRRMHLANVKRLSIRDDLRRALAEVYAGADWPEADALLDQLDTLGLRVVRQ